MASASESGSVTLATYAYDALSRRASLTYGNGATMAYTYSNTSDLATLNHDMSGAADDPHFTLGYTPAHQLASRTVSDSNYLWQATGTCTDSYTHNNLNQYTTIGWCGATPASVGYDGNGNLTGATIAGGVWTYLYDAENHMTAASATGTSASYLYDPLNHRSSKLVNSVWTFFLGDTQDDEIAEYSRVSDTDQTPVLLRRYIPGPGVDQPIAMVTAAGARTYFHTDRLGSVIAMSGDSAVKSEGPYTYDPYGQPCGANGTPTCGFGIGSAGVPFKFTGRRLDPETRLYYYRARYYSFDLGRFMQTDPIGTKDDLNLYAYVHNDPIDKLDPLGLETVKFILRNDATQAQVGKALRYLARSPTFSAAFAAATAAKGQTITVIVDANPHANNNTGLMSHSPNAPIGSTWNPRKQLETHGGARQSAALGLGHEFAGHAVREMQDRTQYDHDATAPSGEHLPAALGGGNITINEQRATNVSNAIARELGEPQQNGYGDIAAGNAEPLTNDVTAHTAVTP